MTLNPASFLDFWLPARSLLVLFCLRWLPTCCWPISYLLTIKTCFCTTTHTYWFCFWVSLQICYSDNLKSEAPKIPKCKGREHGNHAKVILTSIYPFTAYLGASRDGNRLSTSKTAQSSISPAMSSASWGLIFNLYLTFSSYRLPMEYNIFWLIHYLM